MTAIASERDAVRSARAQSDAFPEAVQITDAIIRAWRLAGYTMSEHRRASWLYLLARGHGGSALYKIVGPRFHSGAVVYDGFRVA